MQIRLFQFSHPRPDYIPSFEEEIENLGRVPTILYHALEDAAFKARSAQDREFPGEKVDPGLSAAWFRAHALRNLRAEGIDAQEDKCKWTFNRIPFSGISFYFKDRHIRVLKGCEGILPGCGYSLKKKRFYNQVSSSYLETNKPVQTKLNLIVLWDCDFTCGLSQLWLACPREGGKRPDDVDKYWCNPIRHPAEMSPPVSQGGGSPTDDLDDLIRRISDDEERRKEVSNDG